MNNKFVRPVTSKTSSSSKLMIQVDCLQSFALDMFFVFVFVFVVDGVVPSSMGTARMDNVTRRRPYVQDGCG
ncbi:hypothetical protein KIN20_021846 [Parelaphostrongylus tenuis]|uniref:Transmembrane protein n=1 Tax=Parelaphostrongylus tenuis TaxID=148309 RepID=A0AAD5QUX4_PARTN|nr:hypothetical protein KIN20_021846 [Parelaphostrongylus tenuis]